MNQLVPILLVLPLLVFWLWMFSDMTNNNNLPRWEFWDLTKSDDLPSRRLNWTSAFIFMSVFAAAMYYATVYRNRF